MKPSHVDMTGRVCVVTGGTSGIGRCTVERLATLGAHTVIVARDPGRAHAAASQIRELAKNADVEVVIADLSSLHDVRGAAETIASRFDRIDVLINNAGVIARTRTLSPDGYELQWAVNHLAPFLLTNLLAPRFGDGSRVVNVSSQVHSQGVIDFEDLSSARYYDPLFAYCRSKLANVLFTYALARRLPPGATANCLHPGVYATTLLNDFMGRPKRLAKLLKLRHPTPDGGAQASVYLATSPELDGVTGTYWHNQSGKTRSSGSSYDVELQERLWSDSAAACGIE